MQFPTHARLGADEHAVADPSSDAAPRREGAVARTEITAWKLLAGLKPAAAGDEKRCHSPPPAERIEHVEREVAGHHRMTMVLATDEGDLRPDGNPRREVDARRTAQKRLRHHAI